jgi:hypothetical protein
LSECLEDGTLLVDRDANAGIRDCEEQVHSQIAARLALDTNRDPAPLREFDGIAQQVNQYLAQAAGIADDYLGQIRRNYTAKIEANLAGRQSHHLLDGVARLRKLNPSTRGQSAGLILEVRISFMTFINDSADDFTNEDSRVARRSR